MGVDDRRVHVGVVPYRQDLGGRHEVDNRLALLQRHEHPALGLGQGEEAAVGPAHSDQQAAHHAVGEAVHEVVHGVGAVHVDRGDGVALGEELGHVRLEQLVHVGHVADDDGAAAEAGGERPALHDAEEDGEEEGEERVEQRVDDQGDVREGRLAVGGHAVVPVVVAEGREERLAGDDGAEDVGGAEAPGVGRLEDVQRPAPALRPQRGLLRLGEGAAAGVHPHKRRRARRDQAVVEPRDVGDVGGGELEPRRGAEAGVGAAGLLAQVEEQLAQRVVARHRGDGERLRRPPAREGVPHPADPRRARAAVLADGGGHLGVDGAGEDEEAVAAHATEGVGGVQGGEGLARVGDGDDDGALERQGEGAEGEAGHGHRPASVGEDAHDLVGRDGHDAQRREERLQVRGKVLPDPQRRFDPRYQHVHLQPPARVPRPLAQLLLDQAEELGRGATVAAVLVLPVRPDQAQHPRDVVQVRRHEVRARAGPRRRRVDHVAGEADERLAADEVGVRHHPRAGLLAVAVDAQAQRRGGVEGLEPRRHPRLPAKLLRRQARRRARADVAAVPRRRVGEHRDLDHLPAALVQVMAVRAAQRPVRVPAGGRGALLEVRGLGVGLRGNEGRHLPTEPAVSSTFQRQPRHIRNAGHWQAGRTAPMVTGVRPQPYARLQQRRQAQCTAADWPGWRPRSPRARRRRRR